MRSLLATLSRPLRLAVLFVLAFSALGLRAEWWNSEWTLRKRITLDGAALSEPVIGAPLLLRLVEGNVDFAALGADGGDFRFVAEDGKTLLPFHVEKIDPVLNEAFVWVKTPELRPGAKTTFWLYYGYRGSAPQKSPEPKATYDDTTALVYHFAERGQVPYDSSGNNHSAQTIGLSSEGAQIGAGLRLDGKTTVTIPAAPGMAWGEGGPLTWSAWIRPTTTAADAVFFSRREGSQQLTLGFDKGVPFVEATYQGAIVRSTGGAVVTANAWHHLAVVANGDSLTLYVDGARHSAAAAALPRLNGPTILGGNGSGGLLNTGGLFVGELDELQIRRVALSESALRFAAISQGPDAARLVTFGENEQPSSWLSALETGYVGVILKSLTIDGWVVIVLLLIMSIISWIVMVGKVRYLNRLAQGNALFLEQWSHVARDLSVLDSDQKQASTLGGRADPASQRAMRNSSLYRLYHVGVQEIQHRLGGTGQKSGRALSAQSIQAIRASLDGALVRESSRLNSHIVLLTIAIAGGPFLGLLGTVVGVMITFAAVAAAGDVNVNAIAPGIAAALAATVAGLAVAIPALFGYNYLLTKIKAASNDMHVFIDEFVTKLAEFYAGPDA